jgi:tetratricopeptide (TPR) repeat protein
MRGKAYANKQDFDHAVADYTAAIELDPDDKDGYSSRGSAYEQKGDYVRALDDYTQAIKIDPDDKDGYLTRGNAYQNKRDFANAFADYTKVIELAPTPGAYATRGLAYAANGSYDAALADYEEAIKLDTKYANAFTDRGDVFSAKQDYARAIADYKEAIKLVLNDEERARVLRHRGFFVFLGRNDIERAIADFKAAIRLDPKSAYGVLGLYLARARPGDSKAAAAELEANAQKLNPQDWPYPAVELFLGKRTPEGILAAAPPTLSERCDANVYVGEWYLLQRDNSKAVDALKGAVSTCPKADFMYGLARAELKRLAALSN